QLKEMDFSISEIKQMLNYQRIKKAYPEIDDMIKSYYKHQLDKIEQKKFELTNREEKIRKLLEAIEKNRAQKTVQSGIDLNLIHLLYCETCSSPLTIKRGDIKNGTLKEGVLTCNCGQDFQIKEGIIFLKGSDLEKPESCVKNNDDCEVKFPKEYIASMVTVENWLNERILTDIVDHEILLDVRTLCGVYATSMIKTIKDKNILYLGVERNLSFLKRAKHRIDQVDKSLNTLFFCGDIRKLPIKVKTADMIVDVYGSMADMRETGHFKLKEKMQLLKNNGKYYGIFTNIRNMNLENPIKLLRSLDINEIKKDLSTLRELTATSTTETDKLGEFDGMLSKKTGQERLSVKGWIGEKESAYFCNMQNKKKEPL
ncbi:MAG: hypothetical protein ACOC4J_00965, partial [Bacteroidota bacterium]